MVESIFAAAALFLLASVFPNFYATIVTVIIVSVAGFLVYHAFGYVTNFRKHVAERKAKRILDKYQNRDRYFGTGNKVMFGLKLNNDERRIVRLQDRLNVVLERIYDGRPGFANAPINHRT